MAFANLTNDFVFRRIFATHPDILRGLLNNLLDRQGDQVIEGVEYLLRSQLPLVAGAKLSILDVRCRDVYLTATLDAATWGAELAFGEGPGRIYMVEPTGPIADDPNLTDKKYPGNPTKSYRTRDPLRVTGEVTDWKGHSPEEIKAMKDHLERLRQLGIEAIED
ncbi:MAG: NAD(+)--rifampin ADP-ribosyltransferase [Byssovorax sp.]